MKKIFVLMLVLCLVMTVGCGSTETVSEKISIPDEIPENFILEGGNGLWSTTLTIKKDGSYSGKYLEQTGEENYENTLYYNYNIAEFFGEFKSIEKIDDFTYCLTVGSYSKKYETGDYWIEENKIYNTAEGEGFYGCEKFMIYLPGKSTSGLSENFLMWLPDKISDGKLTTFVLHNTEHNYGFVRVN